MGFGCFVGVVAIAVWLVVCLRFCSSCCCIYFIKHTESGGKIKLSNYRRSLVCSGWLLDDGWLLFELFFISWGFSHRRLIFCRQFVVLFCIVFGVCVIYVYIIIKCRRCRGETERTVNRRF